MWWIFVAASLATVGDKIPASVGGGGGGSWHVRRAVQVPSPPLAAVRGAQVSGDIVSNLERLRNLPGFNASTTLQTFLSELGGARGGSGVSPSPRPASRITACAQARRR
jgi:hypothetical protein